MSMTVHIAMKGITDLEILLAALHEMGIKTIRADSGHHKTAPNVLAYADIHDRRVKFVRHKSGEIDLVGDSDWQAIRDNRFQQRLRQQYSVAVVKKKVSELRYSLASIETLEDGAIKLVARAWR